METRRIPIIVFVLLAILLCAPSLSFAQIRVFACEPEWAALAEEIGGDRIKAFSATSARQDPHYIRAKPSLLAKIRKADLLICSGRKLGGRVAPDPASEGESLSATGFRGLSYGR